MMPTTLKAHINGSQIIPDEPLNWPDGAEVLITLLKPSEAEDWRQIALHSLARAYGNDEPEYSEADLK